MTVPNRVLDKVSQRCQSKTWSRVAFEAIGSSGEPLHGSTLVWLFALADGVSPAPAFISRAVFQLRELELLKVSVSSDCLNRIAAALVGSNVDRLSLKQSNTWGHGGLANAIFCVLPHTRIAHLDLSECHLGKFWTAKTMIFSEPICLMTLNLSGNCFNDNVVVALAKALKMTPRLQELNLMGNRFRRDGAKFVLAQCPVACTVNLSKKYIAKNVHGEFQALAKRTLVKLHM
ncbi:Aste57867_1233 [Aphanomyces stellatus]|uniref:Aste57867_1233 protein n=1 Tax=Aphanomyces stellatus TaxID=120398 RepID=A0A485K5R7_9STRA|nr:hypothetical protein As57867_001232 [Aphanomyces stellatus]VFT78452.1 Aste57867_1233 [Aphanomyces stellatus]